MLEGRRISGLRHFYDVCIHDVCALEPFFKAFPRTCAHTRVFRAKCARSVCNLRAIIGALRSGIIFNYTSVVRDASRVNATWHTSSPNLALVPRTPRVSKSVLLIAFIQQRRRATTESRSSSTSIPTHASTADSASTSARCRRSSRRTMCQPSGRSTSRSTLITSRSEPRCQHSVGLRVVRCSAG